LGKVNYLCAGSHADTKNARVRRKFRKYRAGQQLKRVAHRSHCSKFFVVGRSALFVENNWRWCLILHEKIGSFALCILPDYVPQRHQSRAQPPNA
jgi:hypothetical protein